MILFRTFLILTLFLGRPMVASAQADEIDVPDYVHLFLGEEEMWIPNHLGLTGFGPNPPIRRIEGIIPKAVPRFMSNGDPILFYPLVTPPPYYVDSIMISQFGSHKGGFYEILASNGDLNLLMGITNIQIGKPARRQREPFEDIEPFTGPYSGFYFGRKNRSSIEYFASNNLQLFGEYISGTCAQLSPREPEGRWCSIRGRMPNGGVLDVKVNVNYSHSESWEDFDKALEGWAPRLRALEALLMSFYVSPDHNN